MPLRNLIICAAIFAAGFGLGTYWQSLLRALDTATYEKVEAKKDSTAHAAGAVLAETNTTIEGKALKEIAHAKNEADGISRGIAAGTIGLQLNGTCATASQATADSGVANGAGAGSDSAIRQHREASVARPQLNREAEPDYLAVRAALKRCPAKVAALQAILKEERSIGNAK